MVYELDHLARSAMRLFDGWNTLLARRRITPIAQEGCPCRTRLACGTELFRMPERADARTGVRVLESHARATPPCFVHIFRKALCFSRQEKIYSSPRRVVPEHTSQKNNPHIGRRALSTCRAPHVQGSVAHLLRRAGIRPDHDILSTRHAFQWEYLALLGISETQVIPAQRAVLIQADERVTPSLINNWEPITLRGVLHPRKQQYLPSWLPAVYDGRPSRRSHPERRLHVCCRKAGYRNFVNEPERMPILKRDGCRTVHLEDSPVHGTQGVRVLELLSRYDHDSGTSVLATTLGLDDRCLAGDTECIDAAPQRKNTRINAQSLDECLRSLS